MALYKYDRVHGERFVVPIRGLYLENKIDVDEFKERNAGLMKNRWIETVSVDKGEKIYELFDPNGEGEIIKESLQEWLCDNCLEITNCINIALRNHERTYAEWFKYVDDNSGPDELALYSLSRKFGIHTSVYNKSYVWTTLMNHITRSDEELYQLSGVNLIYLGETNYGIIREIRVPQPDTVQPTPKSRGHTSKKKGKVMCRDNSRSRRANDSSNKECSTSSASRTRRAHSLSESRRTNYGITPTNTSTRPVRSNRRKVDYVSLNDGYYENSTPANKRRKESFRPRSAPSATRLSAHKRKNSSEILKAIELPVVPPTSDVTPISGVPITTDEILLKANELPVVPSTSDATPISGIPITTEEIPLSGVPTTDNTLPDLVVIAPLGLNEPTATNTFEDLEAASALLSLGDTLEDTLEDNLDDDDNEMPIGGANNPEDVAPVPVLLDTLEDALDDDENDNAVLMPIGGANNPVDVAPQPVHLDQVSVDNVIAGIVNDELTELDGKQISKTPDEAPVNPLDHVNVHPPPNAPDDVTPNVRKGCLKTKTYALRKKPNTNRLFKCSECNVTKSTVHALNEHHRRRHNPQMCGICNRTFALASSLTRHMYEHEEKRYQCEQCEYSSHFASELETHKIVHRKTPTHKCMHANCSRWFLRKWDLTLHLQSHDGQEHKCDYEECKFSTTTKKQLKEHYKTKHSDDHSYECKICHQGFRYRSGLKRHRDKEHMNK